MHFATMCQTKLMCHMFILFCYIFFTVNGQYEPSSLSSSEEESVQPNRIDEVNNNFVCNSDGYFADVTYGCQYYHVCENANSPYDKPSFVKHTFSCVNGTVFNQMSFTCTRYQDSIPCETSPNYFYLNKRNGDPKAYFLTDEDIVKHPVASEFNKQFNHQPQHQQKQQQHRSTSLLDFNEIPNKRQAASTASILNEDSYGVGNGGGSSSNSPHVASSISSVSKQPPSSSFLIKDNGGDHQTSLDNSYDRLEKYVVADPAPTPTHHHQHHRQSQSNSYQSIKANAPYEIENKYISTNSIKPGVRYGGGGSGKSLKSSKYESALLNKSYGYGTLDGNNYEKLIEANNPNNNIQIINNDIISDHQHHHKSSSPYRSFVSHHPKPKLTTMHNPPYQLYQTEKPLVASSPPPPPSSVVSVVQNFPKKAAFTPASFTKMYVENQKASKYSSSSSLPQMAAHAPPSVRSGKVGGYNQPQQGDLRETTTATYFPRQKLVSSQPNYQTVNQPISVSSNRIGPKSQSQHQQILSSKYEPAELNSPDHSLIKSNQYVVPYSVRIIDPAELDNINGNGNSNGKQTFPVSKRFNSPLPPPPPPSSINNPEQHQLDRTATAPNLADEPVKISFVSHKTDSQGGNSNAGNGATSSNYGNLRVVKQVKGKNLLIDPSLENDPARDNIIAQVLEMLNKYN